MLRLVRSYRERPGDEWRPLFCRILFNAIRDWRRRQAVRSRIFARRRPSAGGEDELFVDPVDLGADGWSGPGDRAMHAEAMQRLEQAIGCANAGRKIRGSRASNCVRIGAGRSADSLVAGRPRVVRGWRER